MSTFEEIADAMRTADESKRLIEENNKKITELQDKNTRHKQNYKDAVQKLKDYDFKKVNADL